MHPKKISLILPKSGKENQNKERFFRSSLSFASENTFCHNSTHPFWLDLNSLCGLRIAKDKAFRTLVASALRASIDFQSLTENRMRAPSIAIIPAYNFRSMLVNRVGKSQYTSAMKNAGRERRTHNGKQERISYLELDVPVE